jgi:hypothetical protein
MSIIPFDLIELLSLPDDPDLEDMKPPKEIRSLILEADRSGALTDVVENWLKNQRDLQAKAEEELLRLNAGGELRDPSTRGLPSWFTQKWAVVLNYRWSSRLAEAIDLAQSWK